MRIAVGSFMHESNTFARGRTELADFRIAEGAEVWSADAWSKESKSEAEPSSAGIFDVLREYNIEIIPTLFATAVTGSTISRNAYETIKQGMLDELRAFLPVDGICLALHGSAFVEEVMDAEGDLLAAIREIVGAEMPIVSSLDMHGTVTDRMMQTADAYVGYKTAPHTDKYATGRIAAEIIYNAVTQHKKLCMRRVSFPMLVCGEQSETDKPPMRYMIEALVASEKKREVISASYLIGFPWADVPYHNVSAIVVGYENDSFLLEREALRLAHLFWDRRHEFTFTTEAFTPEKAIEEALSIKKRPVGIADSGDNIGAGATGDSTYLTRLMIDRGVKDVLVVLIADPVAYKACKVAGEGSSLSLELGRETYSENSQGMRCHAKVVRIGSSFGVGAAVIEMGGLTLIVTERRTYVFDPAFVTNLGLDPTAFRILVLKCGYLSPEYQAIVSHAMMALTPGDTDLVFSRLPYKRIVRPVFPFDATIGDFRNT